MAPTKQICLVTIMVLFAFIQIANSLKCVTCLNPSCDQVESLLCLNPTDECLKIENGAGDKVREKRCGTVYDCQTYENCYHCKNVDDCNSSSSITPGFLIMGVAGIVLAKFYI